MKKSEIIWLEKAFDSLPCTDAKELTHDVVASQENLVKVIDQLGQPEAVELLKDFSKKLIDLSNYRYEFARRFLINIDGAISEFHEDRRGLLPKKKKYATLIEKASEHLRNAGGHLAAWAVSLEQSEFAPTFEKEELDASQAFLLGHSRRSCLNVLEGCAKKMEGCESGQFFHQFVKEMQKYSHAIRPLEHAEKMRNHCGRSFDFEIDFDALMIDF
ncbi:MAG: hypothetical protein S4CHLAM102_09160 [Chlamydiia bacterium]|nr:hypothetical protein [Chlamydiia bacterium]